MKHKKRTTHWMRPNVGTSVPRNLCFVQVHPSTITDPNDSDRMTQRLDFGVAEWVRWQGGREERWQRLLFTKSVQFWGWFVSRHRPNTSIWLIGHGIARAFTLLDGWRQLDSGFYRLTPDAHDTIGIGAKQQNDLDLVESLVVDNDPPVIVLLHRDGCCVHLVDVENYGRCTMEELLEWDQSPIVEAPFLDSPFQLWRNYMEYCVYAVRKYFVHLVRFWDEHQLGNWRHTAGGLAMAAWRHKFYTDKVLVHTCPQALELERESLVGGEFRCFWVGRVVKLLMADGRKNHHALRNREQLRYGPVYQLDVNSLYPSVMRNNLYPRDLLAWKEPGSIEDVVEWLGQLCVIAQVYVESETDCYPYVHDGERFWSRGAFWTSLCGPELRRAVDRGHVKAVNRVAAYGPGRLFTDFVDWFHSQRQAARERGDVLGERWCKLLPVALSGKFGQRHHPWDGIRYWSEEYPDYGSWPEVMDDGTVREMRAISGLVQVKQLGVESLNSIPAIEAYINSYGRVRMAQLRELCGAENLIYQDSDGLHVTQAGYERLAPEMEQSPGALGALRLVRVIEEAEYRGPHDYTANGEHCVAGMPPRSPIGEHGEWQRDDVPTLRTILTRQPGGFLRIRRVRLQMGHYHPRGVMEPDGSVTPPRFVEPQDYRSAMILRQPPEESDDMSK